MTPAGKSLLAQVRAATGLIAVLLVARTAWQASYVRHLTVPGRDLARTHSTLQIPGNIERFLNDVRGAVPRGSSVAVLLPEQPSIDDFPNSVTRRAMYLLAGRRVEQHQPGAKLTADFLIALGTPVTVEGYREVWSRDGGVLAERTR